MIDYEDSKYLSTGQDDPNKIDTIDKLIGVTMEGVAAYPDVKQERGQMVYWNELANPYCACYLGFTYLGLLHRKAVKDTSRDPFLTEYAELVAACPILREYPDESREADYHGHIINLNDSSHFTITQINSWLADKERKQRLKNEATEGS